MTTHPLTSHELRSSSPWDGRVLWQGHSSSGADCVQAVQRLQQAWPRWRSSALAERAAALRALGEELLRRRENLISLLQQEAGKVAADAQAEVDLLGKKITLTLEQGLARCPQELEDIQPPQARSHWRPRGVAVVLGPFNFPLHLVHGLVVPALAVGAPVVIKPSPHCPALGEAYYEACCAAGLGEVVALIHGGAEVVETLIQQPAVATLAAVGSRAMALALAQHAATRPELLLALELGGVNQALVCPAALQGPQRAQTLAAVAEGAWKMSGQRCTATRIVHVPQEDCPAVCAELDKLREQWLPPQSCGPLINDAAAARFRQAYAPMPPGLQLLAGELAETGPWQVPLLLRVHSAAAREHRTYREEQFGPALIVDPYTQVEEALQRMNHNPYRLAAAVFTPRRADFLPLAKALDYGQVNHNRPTAGARSDMPFGGRGCSGNGRPAAIAAGAIFADECVVW